MDPRNIRPIRAPDAGLTNFVAMLRRMHLIPLPHVPAALRNRFSPSQAFLLVCLIALMIGRNRA